VYFSSVVTLGQAPAPAPPPPATDTVAPEIPGVVAGGAKVHVIKDGFNGSEGTIALPDGSVIFSETTANRTIKIDKDDKVSTFLENTNGSNGMAFDSEGRLFVTQVPFGTSGIAIIYPAAAKKTLVNNYDGKLFGRANDLTVARNGGVYFTDSANPTPQPPNGLPLPPALYYLPPKATKPIQLLTDVRFPNGLVLSRDEKILYLNNTNGEYVIAFDVQPDGSLKNQRAFAKLPFGNADGSTVDAAGRLYVTGGAAVHVIAPDGKYLGNIPAPGGLTSVAFSGPDKKTLHIVFAIRYGGMRDAQIYAIETIAQGYKGRAK
jgi:gluconolactonase